ncbi:MAG TPA: nuclear transport factor 2 family protein [Rhizomicrobium sp.]|nr:nuclear transport factor 2 family protein [Rhizomicrobium sp.]
MSKLLPAITITVLLASGAAFADNKVLDHHVANMKTGDLEAVLSDYASDAVVVTPAGMVSPNGVFTGKDTRKLFSALTSKDSLPGNKTMETKYEALAPDTTLMRWVQFKGTPKEISGYDVFVIRGSKIVFQTVTVNPAKK